MGARQEGKKKKKSVKAKITSQTSANRKLSRFGKNQKKGLVGPGTDFVTRSAALKRLQVSLKDFRRLCILKGIYPRVPPKAPKGSDKVYYDIKDLSYLSHEPLLAKFRDFKSFMKKIRKAAGRKEFSEARRRDELKPVMNLDHLVKERYPRFIDALRDMDDALCMLHLFAAMPSQGQIVAQKTLACAELCRHWQYYVAKSKCLHKVFASVKGFYYQAEIMGERITWLVPHQFAQSVPKEVDLRVMMTFLDFYEVFVRFSLYKLYHMQGLRYPPVADKALLDSGCCLLAIKASPLEAEGTIAEMNVAEKEPETKSSSSSSSSGKKGQKAVSSSSVALLQSSLQSKLSSMEDLDDDDDEEVALAAPLAAAFSGLQDADDDGDDDEAADDNRKTFADGDDNDKRSRLFAKLTFFVNREVPLEWLQVCTLSFAGQIGWDGPTSPFDSSHPGITHHVVDRPIKSVDSSSREYVQPQWVFDCINAQYLLPTSKYAPGVVLPPHLSPFVEDDVEGYVPKYRQEILALVSGKTPGSKKAAEKEKLSAADDEEEEEDEEEAAAKYAKEVKAEKQGTSYSNSRTAKRGRGEQDEDGDDDDEDEEEQEEEEQEEEEEAAVSSKKPVKGPKGVVFKPAEKKVSEVSSPSLPPISHPGENGAASHERESLYPLWGLIDAETRRWIIAVVVDSFATHRLVWQCGVLCLM